MLEGLVDKGNTVIVIEHNLDVIKTADWIIDMGPEGGHKGGMVVAIGTPEEMAETPESYTGEWLRHVLGLQGQATGGPAGQAALARAAKANGGATAPHPARRPRPGPRHGDQDHAANGARERPPAATAGDAGAKGRSSADGRRRAPRPCGRGAVRAWPTWSRLAEPEATR